MKTAPLVSVVIATYNYGEYLAGAIESALGQTLTDIEVIVVDDGSTDDTLQVLDRYRDDRRVRVVQLDHSGQPAAKNAGIRQCRGEFVAFLDADDLWLPTKLEKQISLFRGDPELGVIHCRFQPMDEHGRLLMIMEERPMYRGWVLDKFILKPFVCFSSSMIRRTTLTELGCFDESLPLAIDYDLWLRASVRYRFDHLDERLVLYRSGHANLSRRLGERLECVRRIRRRAIADLESSGQLSASLRRLVWADHYTDTASIHAADGVMKAIAWYSRALAIRPWHWGAWRGLMFFWWPDTWRSSVLRLLGRPDWRRLKVTPIESSTGSASTRCGGLDGVLGGVNETR